MSLAQSPLSPWSRLPRGDVTLSVWIRLISPFNKGEAQSAFVFLPVLRTHIHRRTVPVAPQSPRIRRGVIPERAARFVELQLYPQANARLLTKV